MGNMSAPPRATSARPPGSPLSPTATRAMPANAPCASPSATGEPITSPRLRGEIAVRAPARGLRVRGNCPRRTGGPAYNREGPLTPAHSPQKRGEGDFGAISIEMARYGVAGGEFCQHRLLFRAAG